MNKKAIITVGYTHSGKTTFAHKLEECFEESFVVDTDKIALFLKKDFSKLLYSKNNSFDLDNPNIKLSLMINILDWWINAWFMPILSNWNHIKSFRNFLIDKLRKSWFEVWLVYFNLPIELIKKRIILANKPKDIFFVSKTFEDVLEKQQSYFEKPSPIEVDKFFEIKNEEDYFIVINEVKNWISK